MSFSQIDTDSLICIPTNQARQIAAELVEYDFCKIERDSLQSTIGDLSQIIINKDSIIEMEINLKNTALFTIDSLGTSVVKLHTEIENLEEKNSKLKRERNFLGSVVTTLTSILALMIF